MGIIVRFRGDKEMAAKIRALAREFPLRIEKALYKRAQLIMTDSKQNYVPVDDGPLRGSGTVSRANRRSKLIYVVLSYGDAAVTYALAVHEHTSLHSPPSWLRAEAAGRPVQFSPSGHGPEYLKRPLEAAVPTLPADLAGDLKL